MPSIQGNLQAAVNPQFVQLFSKQIDRYLPQDSKPLPAIQPQAEVLVVLPKPPEPQNPQPRAGGFGGPTPVPQQPLSIDTLSFALFKRVDRF